MKGAKELKSNMEKMLSLTKFYENIKSGDIKTDKELKEKKSKMLFTQQQILKLCMDSKEIIKDMEKKDHI